MNRTVCCLVAALALTGLAWGDLGDAHYVQEGTPAQPGIEPTTRWSLDASEGDFYAPPAGCGTVSPNVVAAVAGSSSGGQVHLAVDSKAPDAKAPDLLRIDFSGKGKFNDTDVVPIKPASGTAQGGWSIGPGVVQVRRGETTIPVVVWGRYNRLGNNRYLDLNLVIAAEATCQFGDKTHAVRIVGGNSDLRLGKAFEPVRQGTRLVGITTGDTVGVAVGEGFGAKDVAGGYYGSPIRVDGAWYDVRISDDATKITAKPLDIKTGHLHVDKDQYSLALANEASMILAVQGDKTPQSVPEGKYTVLRYVETNKQGGWVMCGQNAAARAKSPTVEIAAGKTVALKIGSPLTAGVEVAKGRGEVTLSLQLLDASGTPVDLVVPVAESPSPPAPKLRIMDESGKEVHKGTMEYG